MNNPRVIVPDYKRSIQMLVYAVIVEAAKAARDGSDEAREWIRTEGVIWIDGAYDIWIPPERVNDWIKRGCPLPREVLQTTAPKGKQARQRQEQRQAAYA